MVRPGARELLAEVAAAGVPHALVTGSQRPFTEAVLASTGFRFPVTVTADSTVNALIASLSSLGGSSLGSTACARPVSSRRIRNWMLFWSRTACTQPRTVTRSPTC